MGLFDFLRNNSSHIIDPILVIKEKEEEKEIYEIEIQEAEDPATIYFKNKFKDFSIPSHQIVFEYPKVLWTLERAAELDLVKFKEMNILGYEAKCFEIDSFVIIMPSWRDSNIKLTIEENGYVQVLYYDKPSSQDGKFTLESNLLNYVFESLVNQLPVKIKEEREEREQKSLQYFTRKYRIKSLKY